MQLTKGTAGPRQCNDLQVRRTKDDEGPVEGASGKAGLGWAELSWSGLGAMCSKARREQRLFGKNRSSRSLKLVRVGGECCCLMLEEGGIIRAAGGGTRYHVPQGKYMAAQRQRPQQQRR